MVDDRRDQHHERTRPAGTFGRCRAIDHSGHDWPVANRIAMGQLRQDRDRPVAGKYERLTPYRPTGIGDLLVSSPSEDAFQPSGKVPKALDVALRSHRVRSRNGIHAPAPYRRKMPLRRSLDRFSDRRDFDDPTASLEARPDQLADTGPAIGAVAGTKMMDVRGHPGHQDVRRWPITARRPGSRVSAPKAAPTVASTW